MYVHDTRNQFYVGPFKTKEAASDNASMSDAFELAEIVPDGGTTLTFVDWIKQGFRAKVIREKAETLPQHFRRANADH